MRYVEYLTLGLSLVNFLMSILSYKRISKISLENAVRKQEDFLKEENEIHSMLNSRLLDIQNRKYSIQRGIKNDVSQKRF